MAGRRRGGSALEPTLFPFLSVLASVMGVLILVISGMSQLSLASPDQMVELSPHGTREKTPVYVECQRERLLIYPDEFGQQGAPAPQIVAADRITWDDSPWTQLLESIRVRRAKKYVVLLVRPDAIETFQTALNSVDRALVDVGYDPIYERGELKFQAAAPRGAP